MMFDSRTPRGVGTSAFSQLDAPPERIFVQEAGRVKLLPAYCGTYAFYDGAGELLYIGKAKNVRARVLGSYSLPKSIADCLCVAARETTRCARSCRFVSAEKACTLSAGGLIAMIYEETAAGSAES